MVKKHVTLRIDEGRIVVVDKIAEDLSLSRTDVIEMFIAYGIDGHIMEALDNFYARAGKIIR